MVSYKIVHLGKFYPPEYGGIESVTAALAEDQAAAGHNTSVCCFTRDQPSEETVDGVRVIRAAPLAEIKSQPISLSYIRAGLAETSDADVVHIHTPNLLASTLCLRLPQSAKIVVHWHADIEKKGIAGVAARPLEQAMLERAHAIVCTSQVYAEASRTLRKWSDKTRSIPIGISEPSSLPMPNRRKPFLLFVGRLVPYKGVSVLLRAVATMRNPVSVVIVGEGPEKPALMKLAARLGIDDLIDFRGRVDDAALEELFFEAGLFCLPSTNRLEAFGVVLLEAMRVGCPVISSRIPGSGVSWVNRDGLLFDVDDHQQLATQIDRVMTEPAYRVQLGVAARKRFDSEFGRDLMNQRFMDLYHELVQYGQLSSDSPLKTETDTRRAA